jgi:NhaP-type Na+/H+ or K+/H+ antiporter
MIDIPNIHWSLLASEQVASEDLIYTVATIKVLFSIFAHGMTAAPLAK